MRRKVVSAVACALVALAVPAAAITYGQPDGNRHPHTGALVGTFGSETYPYCSGALVSETVFVTAAHCDIGTDKVRVTFDDEYSARSKLHRGTFYGHPDYGHSQNDPKDVAVVVFDRPIKTPAPARLPEAGLLNRLDLDQQSQFTAVGYGGTEPTNQPGGPVISYPDVRMFSVSSFHSLNESWLRLSQNNATGDGGTCYGDSGGPNFVGAGEAETTTIAAITVTGDALCKATNVTYRLDTPAARAFLGRFVTLP